MTANELFNEFRLLADDGTGRKLWGDAELGVYAAEGELEAARRARLLRDDTTTGVAVYTVHAGDRSLTLDPRVIFVRDCRIASRDMPLERAHKRTLDLAYPKWDSTLNVGVVEMFVPDKETGKIWFSAPFPADDTVTFTVIREPLQAITNGTPAAAYADIDGLGIGPMRVTAAATGTAVNGVTLNWGGATGAGHFNRALSATFTATSVDVTLATDGAGAYDDDANTFAIIADAITAGCLGLYAGVDMGDGTDFVDAAGSATFAHGDAAAVVDPEIQPRYQHGIVQWMMWRAFGKQDAETNDPNRARKSLDAFEAEFGKKSGAIDEVYISEHDQFLESDGTF